MSKEILAVVESVSNEKGVDAAIVIEAIEAALASATKRRHVADIDVEVAIDRETGEYVTHRRWQVVPDDDADVPVEEDEEPFEFDPERHARLGQATRDHPGIALGRLHSGADVGVLRPHRRPDREAGHRAEGARSGTRPDRRGLPGPGGRARDRVREAPRPRQRHPGPRRKRRRDRHPATS